MLSTMSNLLQEVESRLQQFSTLEFTEKKGAHNKELLGQSEKIEADRQSKLLDTETKKWDKERISKKKVIPQEARSSFQHKDDINWNEIVSDLVMVANTSAGIKTTSVNPKIKKKASIQWKDDLNTIKGASTHQSDSELKKLGSEFVIVPNSNPNLQTVGIVDYRTKQEPIRPSELTKNAQEERRKQERLHKPSQSNTVNISGAPMVVEDSFYNIIQKKSQIRFTESELAQKSKHRVKEVLGFQTGSNSQETVAKVQSLTLIKEKPSSENAMVVHVSENIISVAADQVNVATAIDDKNEVWEVESGFSIFKSLNPVAYSPNHSRIKPQMSDISYDRRLMELQEKERLESLCGKTSKCMDFLNTIEFSKLFITNTIEQARESHVHNVWQYGEATKVPSRVIPLPRITTRFWSTIKSITKEEGIFLIEKYIIHYNDFTEDWKYTIFFEGIQDDLASSNYFYVANFSLPTKLYPIAQVTVNLFFKMEVSRVIPPVCPVKVRFTIEGSSHRINPDTFVLNDDVLCRVLDTKLKIFKEYTI